jgi:hypothetical protein
MGFVYTIDYQWGLKGRLRYPAYGETVNVIPLLNATDVDSVGNLAEHSFLGLFV